METSLGYRVRFRTFRAAQGKPLSCIKRCVSRGWCHEGQGGPPKALAGGRPRPVRDRQILRRESRGRVFLVGYEGERKRGRREGRRRERGRSFLTRRGADKKGLERRREVRESRDQLDSAEGGGSWEWAELVS